MAASLTLTGDAGPTGATALAVPSVSMIERQDVACVSGNPATRERKERFLKGDDGVFLTAACRLVESQLMRHGLDWLTDEQIDDLVSDLVASERFVTRLRIQNRKLLQGSAA